MRKTTGMASYPAPLMQLIQVASLDEKCRAEENLKLGRKEKLK